jgi:hypothetical protein
MRGRTSRGTPLFAETKPLHCRTKFKRHWFRQNVFTTGRGSIKQPRMRSSRFSAFRALIQVALLLSPMAAADISAAERTARWTGAADGNWSNAANWDIGQVPQNTATDTYDVIWDAHPVSVTLTQNVTIRNFTFSSGGSLRGTRSLTIGSDFIWNDGSLALGATTVVGSATLRGTAADSLKLDGGVLSLKGSTGLHSHLHCLNNAILYNDTDAVLEAHEGSGLRGDNTQAYVENSGVFRIVLGDQSFPSIKFTNRGQVEVYRTVEFFPPGAVIDFDQRAGALFVGQLGNLSGRVSAAKDTEVTGRGKITEATVLGNLSGSLHFQRLVLGNDALTIIRISNDLSGPSDTILVDQALTLGGNLRVEIEQQIVLFWQEFPLILAPAKASLLGYFANAPFGGRISGFGIGGNISGKLDLVSVSQAFNPCWVVLRDFAGFPPLDPDAGTPLCVVWVSSLTSGPARDIPPAISLATFYALESLMKETPGGIRLASLYRLHTAEVVALLLKNSDLRNQAAAVLRAFQPGVSLLLSAKGHEAQITQPMIDELNVLWTGLANVASPALRAVLLEEQTRYNGFQQFVDKDFSQWAGLLEIKVPVEPWVHLSGANMDEARFTLTVNEVTGVDLSLWRTADLQTWEPVPNVDILRRDFTLWFTDPAPYPGKGFYEFRR